MRFRSSLGLCTVLLCLLAANPVSAAPRDRDDGWNRPLHRLVQLLRKVVIPTINGDGMIPPTPAPKP